MDKPMSDLEEILNALYESEINASISWLWDGGIVRPEPVRETLPPREVYVRPRAPAARRHPAGPVAQTQKLCNQRCYMHVG